MVTNLFLTVSFLVPFGVTGIAAANSLAALFQWHLLERSLRKVLPRPAEHRHCPLPIAFAAAALVLWIMSVHFLLGHFHPGDKIAALIEVSIDITIGGAIYILALQKMHFAEVSLLIKFLGVFHKRRSNG